MTKWLLGICVAIVATIAVFVFVAEGEKPAGISVREARRVVSLAPSMTETVIALGHAHKLVGVTVHCRHAEVAALAKIGSFAEPNFEAIMALRPDLVLGVPHVMAKPVLDRIADHGVEILHTSLIR